ncbi:MAG: glutamyl-tRNA reductase, partial [Planctomycetes bacterium]|nr:glutamyl-tRNA reductase [Planctomycetota bacterium]
MPEPQLHLIGWDHHKSNVQDRERLAVAFGELPEFLAQLLQEPGIEEAVIVSTCNRSEWYVAADISEERLLEKICTILSLQAEDHSSASYYKSGDEVVKHVFRVISSLESMVVGEYQIVHQIKQAYERAQQCHSVAAILHPLFQKALAAGKEIRSQTAIGKYKVSVASIAVDLARKIFGDLSKSRLLIVGAGEMADLTLTHLLEHGVKNVSIINR